MISRGENAAYTTMDQSTDKLGNPRRVEVLRIDLATGALKGEGTENRGGGTCSGRTGPAVGCGAPRS